MKTAPDLFAGNSETRECSRGWGARCAASPGKTCRCACGGHNHGGLRYVSTTREKLTNHRVFEGDAPRKFFANAPDSVLLSRDETGAHADIPRRFVVHSPTGFEWGYGGSGPADLALNILGAFVAPPLAWRLHQRFKFDFIAKLSREGPHVLTGRSIRAWVEAQWAKADAEQAALSAQDGVHG
jgi:hypothetical protein